MAELKFLEDPHIYILEGVQLPSVSELCDPLHKKTYQDVPMWKMEAAAERGTAVHKATQELEATGTADVEDSILPYVSAYLAFMSEHSAFWSLTEQPIFHPEFLYAGTPDRYGILDGKHTLVDFKTTYTVNKPLCRGQLNLYRLALLATGHPVDRMLILHLKPDGTYKLVPIPEDEPLANSLITIHNAFPKRKKKGVAK